MPTEVIPNSTNNKIIVRYANGYLRVEAQGKLLPAEDQSIFCKIDPVQERCVPFELELVDNDPARTITAGHYDAQQEWHDWSMNPCRQELGLTGGFVDVMAVATVAGQQHETIIRIDIRAKVEKPF